MDFKYLKLLDRFKSTFEKMGIDYEVMRRILHIKLLMDGRRVPTVFNDRKKSNRDDNKNMFFRSLWIYLVMGCIMIPFVIMKNSYIFQMSFIFGIVMFFVMSSLISDFSTIILDIRDKSIISVRPVGQKTLNMAKTLHVLYYMLCLTAALTGPALATSLFTQGLLFFLLFLFLLILIDIFCIILTTLIYFLILRFFDGEKLKDIINYMQIILSIVIMVGYQLIGRLFNIVNIKITFVPHWWQYLVIPIWFAAPFQMLQKHQINHYLIKFSAMAIVMPLIMLFFYIKLIPAFEKYLQKLGNNDAKGKNKSKKESIISKLICTNREERIFYHFSMDMMRNERAFKLKVYPTIGYSLIIPFFIMISLFSDTSYKEITQGKTYLFIYFCGIMLPTLIMMMRYSESFKAAWIYKAMPIGPMKPVFQGSIKAFFIKIYLPVYIVEAIIFGVIYGTRIIPDLFVVFLNMLLYSIVCFVCLEKSLPFSKNYETAQQTNHVGVVFILFLLLAALVGIHYIFTTFQFGIFIYLCIDVILLIIMWEAAFNVTTEQLT